MKKSIEELIKYVRGWVCGDIVKATRTYKLLDEEDRKIYALGWKNGTQGVLDKLEEINSKHKK